VNDDPDRLWWGDDPDPSRMKEASQMRLGAPIFEQWSTPDEWAQAVRAAGYSAAFCPIDDDADEATVEAFAAAAESADIVIAEVGAWQNNPISPDPEVREAGISGCARRLELADRIGANCCVNISGSSREVWNLHHPENFTRETFDLVVETVREIIDRVQPTRTYYTLETMPWAPPDSPQCYADLVDAIDRERFAVHLDPVNLVCSPQRYYATDELIEECFELLGSRIVACHGKDIILQDALTVHLSECAPGEGGFDWPCYLRALDRLDPDVPLLLEHLRTGEEYAAAVRFVRETAAAEGVAIR